jgi:tRNA threonylcarbamoyladenosine biosynthesis protein TsaB
MMMSMNLLALDTSTPLAAVALAGTDGVVHVAPSDPGPRHGRALIPAVRDLLARAGLALRDLDALAVGLGPGSYTGLRIGLTAAKTLAYALGKPLIGLDSLEAVARNAPAEALRIAVVADAQRGDLYAADFARSNPGDPPVRLAPTRIEPAALWIAHLAPGTCVLGPGLARLPSPLPASIHAPGSELDRPHGTRLIELAHEAWLRGQRDDPWFLEPVYLRRSAAEDQWLRSRQ